ncbi:uncharacterized protein [Cicer arietinum]|uniref:Uncharacterized protein LOC101511122 n=1 Tax=Cicer arietinum TaxID=3827 RepID=A0A1S2Z8P2_CICAR|nr:uncharacterized protein LOC101511122 [Cicer arietinum]
MLRIRVQIMCLMNLSRQPLGKFLVLHITLPLKQKMMPILILPTALRQLSRPTSGGSCLESLWSSRVPLKPNTHTMVTSSTFNESQLTIQEIMSIALHLHVVKLVLVALD